MSRSKAFRSLSIEQLENRIVFAGDVAAVLNGNTLKIDGDDLGNQILVQRVAADQYRVTGLDGTTINGQAVQNFNIENEVADLRINLKGATTSWKWTTSTTSSCGPPSSRSTWARGATLPTSTTSTSAATAP